MQVSQAIIGTAIFCCIFGMGFWLGRRLGYTEGLATWRMDYRRMTPKDINAHKRIIAEMSTDGAV